MENNKSQAEIYREERKARLEKEAAKKAKKSPKLSKTKKVVGKVIAIVLAVVVALGAVGGILNFFGAPQKVIKVSVSEDKDCSFTVAEFNFYYYNMWSNYAQAAKQYEQYGQGFAQMYLGGFDYTKSPEDQEFTEDASAVTSIDVKELGVDNPTWADAFRFSAVYQLIQIKYGAKMATEQGITLTEDETKEIEDSIEEVRETAKENDYSLDRWFRMQLGNGIGEDTVRKIYTEQSLSTKYFTKLQEETQSAVTEAQIEEKYNANKDNYDIADLRLYTFKAETPSLSDDATTEEKNAALEKAKAEAKSKADAMLGASKDEATFIAQADKAIKSADSESTQKAEEVTDYSKATYAELEQVGEALAKWAYDDARVAGDKTVIDLDGTYAVVLITKLPYKDTSISSHDVRHILVKFPEVAEGSTLSDADKAKCKADAQAILDEYLKNPTEENFSALATSKSADTSSAQNGGLISEVADDGSYVEAFTNWTVDASRKAGDTGIVETEYGYHVMYYVKGNGTTWYETVKNDIFTENFNAAFESVINPRVDSVNMTSLVLKWAVNAQCKHIEKHIAYYAAS